MGKTNLIIETERLRLRPWTENDAEALYRYASNPKVGPIAGWPPHTSVKDSLEIIRTIFAASETYAIVLKQTGEPIGSCGIMMNSGVHSAAMQDSEAEIGYWIGVPYWGKGYTPEAVRALMKRSFDQLNTIALWIGYYDGNEQSHRVAEKCGFAFSHTEKDKISPLGDVRTEHFMRITKDRYLEICKTRK